MLTRDEIIVIGDKLSPVFSVAVVTVNQTHREAGDHKEWIHTALPLEAANQLATSEGQRRGLPVTVWDPSRS
jgi:hypothetical protein